MQMVGQVFTAEKGKVGEIYFQDDGKKAIFKEEVLRWYKMNKNKVALIMRNSLYDFKYSYMCANKYNRICD